MLHLLFQFHKLSSVKLKRIYLPKRTPPGYLGSNAEPEPSSQCLHSSLMHTAFQGQATGWASKPPAFWVNPYKRAPRIKIWPIGLRHSPLIGDASYGFIYIFTNQSEQLHSDQSGPIKLWAFRVLICMKVDQSGTRSGDFSLHEPASNPSRWGKGCVLLAGAETGELGYTPGGLLAQAHLSTMLLHSHGFPSWSVSQLSCRASLFDRRDVSQLSCFYWIKSLPSPHPKLRTPVDTDLVTMNFCWH